MAHAVDDRQREVGRSTEPLVVVSCDSHIGPTFDDLRPYCDAAHVEAFDEYRRGYEEMLRAVEESGQPFYGGTGNDSEEAIRETEHFALMYARCQHTGGHRDMDARRRDMDRDGVAVDVIFHGSINMQPIPFVPSGHDFFYVPSPDDVAMVGVGLHIYNQWLADAVATAPDRHIGLAHIPAWDVAGAIREVEWAAEAGLRGVNLPVPRRGIPPYDHPDWEPFWAACAAGGLTLSCHSGNGPNPEASGPWAACIIDIEVGGWVSRSALHRVLFSGVFERHPGLKLVLTEQNGDWWVPTVREYDSTYLSHRGQLRDVLPRLPSEYLRDHVFIGGSFLAHYQADEASRDGYATNVLWGSDYPHPEGTWQYQEDPDAEPMTRLALRQTFSGVPDDDVRRMVGGNAISVFGLDAEALHQVATRIGAPTLDELAAPLDTIPEDGGFYAFRTVGPWA